MSDCNLTRSWMFPDPAKLLIFGVVFLSAGQHAVLSQSQFDQDVISVPVFLEMLLEADSVVAPLGPDLKPVLSRISIRARGNGFQDITSSLGSGVRVTPLGEQPTGIADGERLEVEAFFDITYQLEIIDMDPDEDFDLKFSPKQGRIRLRLPRGQKSRIEARGTCTADTSLTNFGCLPQLVDPRDPQLTALDAPIWIRDNTFPLGPEATLSLPDTSLVSTFREQIPLGGNAIFADGFESGDTSAWVVSRGSTASSPQSSATSSFMVAASGALDIPEIVVEPSSKLVNYFSLIGEGSTANREFQTTMIFANTGVQSGLRIEFFTPTGKPLPVTLADPPSLPALMEPTTVFETTLGPGQALSLQTAGLQDLQVGYARFWARPSVGATSVFTSSNTSTGATLYDAGVPSITRPLKKFSIFLDSLGVRDTGLAMVKAKQSGNSTMTRGAVDNVRLRLFDTAFNQIATTILLLPEGAQVSRFIWEYFQDQPAVAAQAREMQGVVVVDSKDRLAAVTLRLTNDPEDPTLTAFPVIEGGAEPSMVEALRRGRDGGR